MLAYLAQDVVTYKGWLSAGEMMDGLGLAETTPGPLILVTEFVGYIAAYRAGGVSMGIAGALVTLWVTFAPCFLWIFVGAPYIEQLTAQPRLKGALEAITAAVVGVILNLSIWFGLHVLFAELQSRQIGPGQTPGAGLVFPGLAGSARRRRERDHAPLATPVSHENPGRCGADGTWIRCDGSLCRITERARGEGCEPMCSSFLGFHKPSSSSVGFDPPPHQPHRFGFCDNSSLFGVVEKDPFLESRGDTPFDW